MEEKVIIELTEQINLRGKYLVVRDLCYCLMSLLPKKATRNETGAFGNYIEALSGEEKGLLNLLTHLITLLNSDERMYEKGYYQTEKADVFLALKLIGSKINPVGYLTPEMKSSYLSLSKYFGERIFKASDASNLLGTKKTQTWRILKKLVETGLYYQHKRKGCKGYLYQKIPSPTQPTHESAHRTNPTPQRS